MILEDNGLNKEKLQIKMYINAINAKILVNPEGFLIWRMHLFMMNIPTYARIIIQINQKVTPKVLEVPKNMSIALLKLNP